MRFLREGERCSLTLPETWGRCFLNRHEAQESWEMLLVAFLKPPGELCWTFCLLYPAPDLAAPFQR